MAAAAASAAVAYRSDPASQGFDYHGGGGGMDDFEDPRYYHHPGQGSSGGGGGGSGGGPPMPRWLRNSGSGGGGGSGLGEGGLLTAWAWLAVAVGCNYLLMGLLTTTTAAAVRFCETTLGKLFLPAPSAGAAAAEDDARTDKDEDACGAAGKGSAEGARKEGGTGGKEGEERRLQCGGLFRLVRYVAVGAFVAAAADGGTCRLPMPSSSSSASAFAAPFPLGEESDLLDCSPLASWWFGE
jgi:hypothetical protein